MRTGKNLVNIVTLAVFFILSTGYAEIYKESKMSFQSHYNLHDITRRAQEMHSLLQQKKAEGFNVSKVEELDRLSKKAAERSDFEKCLRLINEAMDLLKNMEKPSLKQVSVVLPVNAEKVSVTKAVPGYTSGKYIKDFSEAFSTQLKHVKDGKIKIKLNYIPIFVEENPEEKKIMANKKNSPFGIQDLSSYNPNMAELGIQWARLSGPAGIVWDANEPEKGKFNWSRTDKIITEFFKHGVNMIVTVLCLNRWDQGEDFWKTLKDGPFKGARVAVARLPKDLKAYSNFLRKAVERYDGDGIDDAPGSPQVNYWQIENEPDGLGWGDTPEKFARLVKVSYRAIKKSNPDAKIVLAGIATPMGLRKFYVPMLDALKKIRENKNERYFDVFDLHWSVETGGSYKSVKNHDMKTFLSNLRKTLDSLGYKDVTVWITEMSSYSGKPVQRGNYLNKRTETEHAAELLKSYVYPLALGVKKIFWVRIIEHSNYGKIGTNNYWDTTGLINNPENDGQSHKKLAFYTYRLMTDKLEGSDWDNIEELNLGKNIHAYKFSKDKKAVYVLWLESE